MVPNGDLGHAVLYDIDRRRSLPSLHLVRVVVVSFRRFPRQLTKRHVADRRGELEGNGAARAWASQAPAPHRAAFEASTAAPLSNPEPAGIALSASVFTGVGAVVLSGLSVFDALLTNKGYPINQDNSRCAYTHKLQLPGSYSLSFPERFCCNPSPLEQSAAWQLHFTSPT